MPASLKEIEVTVEVAGVRVSRERYAPEPDQTVSFTWDGEDTYERPVQGQVPVTVTKTYFYDLVYTRPETAFNVSWGRFPLSSLSSVQPRAVGGAVGLTRVYRGSLEGNGITHLGTWDAREQGLGGWSLDVHHVYDPNAQVLHPGDGGRRTARQIGPVVTRFAGTGEAGYSGDGAEAFRAQIAGPAGITLAPDGTLYIADRDNHAVRKVSPDGVITTVAGTGEICSDGCQEPDGDCDDSDGLRSVPGFGLGGPGGPGPLPTCGDQGPATAAQLLTPEDVALAPDGSLYIVDSGANTGTGCVRRVDASGNIDTVAGRCIPTSGDTSPGITAEAGWLESDGLPPTAVGLERPFDIAMVPDGSYYLATSRRIGYVGTEGLWTTVAGNGTAAPAEGLRGVEAQLTGLSGLALAPSGELFFSRTSLGAHRVWRLSIDGRLFPVAGGATAGYAGDGGLALDALLSRPGRLVALGDGSLYVSDRGNRRVRKIDPAGVIYTVAGNGEDATSLITAPATGSPLREPMGLAVAPDSEIYLADARQNTVLRAGLALEGYSEDEILIASETGGEVYVFDPQGRHQRTVHSLTGADLYRFEYDDGLLSAVLDRSDRRTEIERNASGTPTRIVGPYGQALQLVTDGDGYLERVVDEAGGATAFTYTNGLLTRLVDPRSFGTEWDYTFLGRLARERAPDGGVQEFRRFGRPDDPEYSVTRRDGEGVPTLYRSKRYRDGFRERVVSDRERLAERYYSHPSGRETERDPDGTFTQTRAGADSRFGMQARLPSRWFKRLPSGLTRNSTLEEGSVLADPKDPLSLLSLERTYTLNGRPHRSVYDAATRTFTLTSPEGRTTSIRIDDEGRILEQTIPGLGARGRSQFPRFQGIPW